MFELHILNEFFNKNLLLLRRLTLNLLVGLLQKLGEIFLIHPSFDKVSTTIVTVSLENDNERYLLDQGFPTCGTRTTSGMRRCLIL
jgi:hypothetical protein